MCVVAGIALLRFSRHPHHCSVYNIASPLLDTYGHARSSRIKIVTIYDRSPKDFAKYHANFEPDEGERMVRKESLLGIAKGSNRGHQE